MRRAWLLLGLMILVGVFMAQVRVPGPGGATTASVPQVILGDAFVNMNTSTPGTTLTTVIMGAGTLGAAPGAWSLSPATPTGYTVGAHSAARVLPSSVIVSGTTYATSTTSQSMSLDNTHDLTYADLSVPLSHQTVVYGGKITLGPTVNGSSQQLYDIVRMEDTLGHICIVQQTDGAGAGNYTLRLESDFGGTIHSGSIVVTTGSTYWVTAKCDAPNSLGSLAVYDTSMVQVGSTVTVALNTGHPFIDVKIGNVEAGISSGTTFFENQVIDYSTGVFPMIPAATPQIYFVASKSNDTSASGTTVAATMPTTLTGDAIVCAAFWNSTSRTGSVADVANGAYTAVDSPVNITGIGTYRMQTFYKTGITGAATPAVTFTMSGAAAAIDRAISCHEVHGVTSIDKHPAINLGTSATMTSAASGTTSTANEYLFGVCLINAVAQDPWVQSATQLWNLRELSGFEGNPSADSIVGSTGSYTFTAFQNSSAAFGCALNTFQ